MSTDQDGQSTHSHSHHSNPNSGHVGTKNSKARFSMPTYPANITQYSEHNKPQGNSYQNQLMYNPNANTPSHSELFNLHDDFNQKNDPNLRDIMNIQSQKDNISRNPSKQGSNIYQPNLYQNNHVPTASDQPKHPYNFAAQINFPSKKAPSPDKADQFKSGSGQKGSEESLQQINKRHEELINVILAEEEEVISLHRQHIDDMVDLVKQV